MSEVFLMPLDALTPSQLYISGDKLSEIMRWFDGDVSKIDPVPLKRMAGRLLMTDGHTRAAAAFLSGCKAIPCVWETDSLTWEAYAADINACAEEGITSVEALSGRVVSGEDYERLWCRRCDEIQKERYYAVLTQTDEIIFYTVDPAGYTGGRDIRPYDPGFDDGEYFMLYSQGAPAAMGSIERYSFEFWEAASIRVYPGFRRKGFGRAMTAFLTDKIVSSGKTATCRTLPENAGMNRIIAECGYQRLYTDI